MDNTIKKFGEFINESKTKNYNFAAEALVDVVKLISNGRIKYSNIVIQSETGLGWDVSFDSPLTKEDIIKAMEKIPDSHVMIRTLK